MHIETSFEFLMFCIQGLLFTVPFFFFFLFEKEFIQFIKKDRLYQPKQKGKVWDETSSIHTVHLGIVTTNLAKL